MGHAVKNLRLITTPEKGGILAHRLIAESKPIAVDCEGVRLGRFGRLSLIQIGENNGDVSLVDAGVPGVVESLTSLLTSAQVPKIMHDCREDSASLYHQHNGIRLENVFDTQIASLLVQRKNKAVRLRQFGYSDLIERVLGEKQDSGVGNKIKKMMVDDPFLWHKRPLTADLVKYAIHGVEYLLPLWRALELDLQTRDISRDEVSNASDAWVSYYSLNTDIKSPNQAEKIGTPLFGMVASITDKGVYFKLNIGRTGVCCTPSALRRMLGASGGFARLCVGDTVELAVSGASLDGRIIYVDRRDPDWEYFDFFRRPSPQKKESNEYRHVPSLLNAEEDTDPLLRRGLGPGGSIDSDDEGEVDHDPILTQKPIRYRDS